MYDSLITGLEGASGLDLLVLWVRVTASGVSFTLLAIVATFAIALSRRNDRQRTVASCFALANLFAVLYIASDTAVRFDVLLGNHDLTPFKIRLAFASVILATAAYFNFYWVLAANRRLPARRMLAVYLGGLVMALTLWVEHPLLIIASNTLQFHGMSVFPEYGALAPAFFALLLALGAAVLVILLCSPLRHRNRLGWSLNLIGFSALLLAGAHDALRELGVFILPMATLSIGFTCFQVGAFSFLAFHYARLLQERSDQQVRLQRMSDALERDQTTGLFTKSFLQKHLDRLGPNAQGGLLFIDLDNFKAVNDQHGHLCGDIVIADVANLLRQELRSKDLPCRWGGDEFLVYLPDTEPHHARALGERLMGLVDGLRFGRAPDLRIRMSMGYAPFDGGDWRETIARADAALYQSKHNGRNRITVFEHGSSDTTALALP